MRCGVGDVAGLFVLDATHVPTGCSLWPAWRFVKDIDKWGIGEIDVIEGENLYDENLVTMHNEILNCNQQRVCEYEMYGQPYLEPDPSCEARGGDCPADWNPCNNPHKDSKYSCPIKTRSIPNLGAAFNRAGGGVYVMERTSAAIKARGPP